MVKGLDIFREYFKDYTNQYVLIGGTACTVSFEQQNESFGRTTKDLDMVLIVEALTKEFGDKFWKFIHDGGYRNRLKSNRKPQFYRFDKPNNPSFPEMIEIFSRTDSILAENSTVVPIHIDDSLSSLSAILLNDAYYRLLMDGRNVINGLSVLSPVWLIPFKAKAWLDLKQHGNADSKDIKKHKNDIIRLASGIVLEKCVLPEEVRNDIKLFIDLFEISDAELKNLDIKGVKAKDIKDILTETYL
jgi:hypothetical protein